MRFRKIRVFAIALQQVHRRHMEGALAQPSVQTGPEIIGSAQ